MCYTLQLEQVERIYLVIYCNSANDILLHKSFDWGIASGYARSQHLACTVSDPIIAKCTLPADLLSLMLPSVTLNASLLGFYIGVSGINRRSNDFFSKHCLMPISETFKVAVKLQGDVLTNSSVMQLGWGEKKITIAPYGSSRCDHIEMKWDGKAMTTVILWNSCRVHFVFSWIDVSNMLVSISLNLCR